MGFELRRINPLDLQPRKAVGVFLPFSGAAVFNSTYQTRDAIKTNVINYILTGVRERYLNPRFGTELTQQLFENINEEKLKFLSSYIQEGLRDYFPRIIVNDFQLVGDPDRNTILFTLRYSINETNIQNEEINIEVA